MPSTYSDLKLQLMATGENSTTWGTITNLNLEALEDAVVGSADVTFASANVTLTLTDANTPQTARNLRLRCTGTTGGVARNLVVPAIEKPFIVRNDCGDNIVVRTASGTGVTVPPAATMWVYCDGTNVVDAVTHLSGLTLNVALPVSSGGTGATSATGARTALGATTLGANLFTLANPSAITFPRFNADNTVSALSAADFRTALGVGNGTVTSVSGTGTVNGITLTGNVTTSGSLTLGGTLSGVSLTTQVAGTLPIANGGTNATTASGARTSLGATTVGANLFTLADPSATTFLRLNADNTVSALNASDFRVAIGANTGTVTSVTGTGSANGLTLSGTVTSSGNITLGGSVTSVASGATIDGVIIGFRNIPRSTTSGTAVVADVGRCIALSAGITIPNSTFAAGDAVSLYNDSGSTITITQGSGLTLRRAATGDTGNRTLAARGMATIWFNSASEAIISGPGVL